MRDCNRDQQVRIPSEWASRESGDLYAEAMRRLCELEIRRIGDGDLSIGRCISADLGLAVAGPLVDASRNLGGLPRIGCRQVSADRQSKVDAKVFLHNARGSQRNLAIRLLGSLPQRLDRGLIGLMVQYGAGSEHSEHGWVSWA